MPLLPSYTLLQAYSVTLIGSSVILLLNPLALLNSSPLWMLGESMHIRRASFVPSNPSLGQNPSAHAPGVTLHGKRSVAESLLGSGSGIGIGGALGLLSNDVREVLALLGLVLFFAAATQAILVTPLRYSKGGLSDLARRSSIRGGSKTVSRAGGGDHSQMLGDGQHSNISEFAEKIHTLHTAQTLFLSLSAVRVVLEGALVAYIYLRHADRSHKLGADIRVADEDQDSVLGLLANRIVFAAAMTDMLFWGYIWTVLREEARDVAEVVHWRRKLEEEDDGI